MGKPAQCGGGPLPPFPFIRGAGVVVGARAAGTRGLKLQTERGEQQRTREEAWISLNLAATTPALDHLTREKKLTFILFKPLLVGT